MPYVCMYLCMYIHLQYVILAFIAALAQWLYFAPLAAMTAKRLTEACSFNALIGLTAAIRIHCRAGPAAVFHSHCCTGSAAVQSRLVAAIVAPTQWLKFAATVEYRSSC